MTNLVCNRGPTEFEIQAELWSTLREFGYAVRGEINVLAVNQEAYRRGQNKCRFDICEVSDDGLIVGVIEVKNSRHHDVKRWERTRQGRRYYQFGVPVIVLFGERQMRAFLNVVDKRGYLFQPPTGYQV